MTLKKMLLAVGMALATIAFAAPAAQATPLNFNTATEEYEGFLDFHRPASSLPTGTFGCEVTIKIVATGGTSASVTEFNPTTESCAGSGLFEGCELREDTSNVPFTASTTTTDIVLTKPGSDIQIHNKYENCAFGIAETTLQFGEVTAHPDPTTGAISTLTISGISTGGFLVLTTAGTFHAETNTAITLSAE